MSILALNKESDVNVKKQIMYVDASVKQVLLYLFHPFILTQMVVDTTQKRYTSSDISKLFNKKFKEYSSQKLKLNELKSKSSDNSVDLVIKNIAINRAETAMNATAGNLSRMNMLHKSNSSYLLISPEVTITNKRLIDANTRTKGTEYQHVPYPNGKEGHKFMVLMDNPLVELLAVCKLGTYLGNVGMNQYLYSVLTKFMDDKPLMGDNEYDAMGELTSFYVIDEFVVSNFINTSILGALSKVNQDNNMKNGKEVFTVHGQMEQVLRRFTYLKGDESTLVVSGTRMSSGSSIQRVLSGGSLLSSSITLLSKSTGITRQTLLSVFNTMFLSFREYGSVECSKIISCIQSQSRSTNNDVYKLFMDHLYYLSVYPITLPSSPHSSRSFNAMLQRLVDSTRVFKEGETVANERSDRIKQLKQMLVNINSKRLKLELGETISQLENDTPIEETWIRPVKRSEKKDEEDATTSQQAPRGVCGHVTLDQEIRLLQFGIQETILLLQSIKEKDGSGSSAYITLNKKLSRNWGVYANRKRVFESYVSDNRCNRCGSVLYYDITHKKSFAEIKERIEIIEREKATGVLQERLGREQMLR
jgi:hypothetical protein